MSLTGHAGLVGRWELKKRYGKEVVAVAKRQLCSREIKKLKLRDAEVLPWTR